MERQYPPRACTTVDDPFLPPSCICAVLEEASSAVIEFRTHCSWGERVSVCTLVIALLIVCTSADDPFLPPLCISAVLVESCSSIIED